MFSELTRDRFRRFKRIKRAYYSLLILGICYLISLFSDFVANDKPYILRYEGKTYFPIVKQYASETFGGKYRTEADYLVLTNDSAFIKRGGWMLFPPIPHDPLHSYLDEPETPPHKPSLRHWMGTDATARDILARLIYGFRICMTFALLLAALVAVLGIVIGGLQGYLGGKIDITFQRLIEIWASLPFLYVVILFGSIYGRGFFLLLVVLAIFSWVGLSYYMRGEFLKLKNMTYVQVSRALGLSQARIFFKHLLPNALTPVVTIIPFTIIGGISSLTALDFLGFGLQPPTPSWGEMLSQGLQHLYAPWIAVFSIIALFVTLLLATFIGEGVREAFDPKSEGRVE
jgi:microcin C transport system permease protein